MGEFCNAMGSSPVTAAQQANFSLAQMQAVGAAQAGWFFWSYKMNVTGERGGGERGACVVIIVVLCWSDKMNVMGLMGEREERGRLRGGV